METTTLEVLAEAEAEATPTDAPEGTPEPAPEATPEPPTLSPAQRRLQQARERGPEPPAFEPVELEGETLYVSRLRVPEIWRIFLTATGSTNGVLDLTRGDAPLRAFTLVSLACCIYAAPVDGARYFASLEEAAAWVDSPAMALKTAKLFTAAIARNPLLTPSIISGDIPPSETPADEPSAETPAGE